MSRNPVTRNRQRQARLAIDTLESRITPSVTWSLSPDGTEFSITSDNAADRVFISFNNSNVLTLAVRNQGNVVYSGTVNTLVEFEYDGNGGNDVLRADNVRAGISVNARGGDGDDALHGGDANDRFEGGIGSDTLNGGAGDDQLFGNEDNDHLAGDDGDDDQFGGFGDDVLVGGRGADELFGEDGNDELRGQVGNDQLDGGNNDDQLFGDGGDDFIRGQDGADLLRGEAGNDWLEPGTGADFTEGGNGVDTLMGIDADDTRAFGGRNGDLFVSFFVDEADFVNNFLGEHDFRTGLDIYESDGTGGGGFPDS